jgi:hypothetical protein
LTSLAHASTELSKPILSKHLIAPPERPGLKNRSTKVGELPPGPHPSLENTEPRWVREPGVPWQCRGLCNSRARLRDALFADFGHPASWDGPDPGTPGIRVCAGDVCTRVAHIPLPRIFPAPGYTLGPPVLRAQAFPGPGRVYTKVLNSASPVIEHPSPTPRDHAGTGPKPAQKPRLS